MTRYDLARGGDYSLSSLEMGVALSAIPPQRRSNAWLLLLGAPVATSLAREALRSGGRNALAPDYWTILGPALVSGVAGVFLWHSATRSRTRCSY
jgi:hypothetical protein